jgi:hypothetical protein
MPTLVPTLVRRPVARRRAPAVRAAVRAAAVALLVPVLACEVPAPTAPPVRPGLVVFAVLGPGGVDQTVLLMQSRAAVPDAAARPFNPNDPIVTTGETPVIGARVVLRNAAGDSAVLVEDRVRRTDRLGAGVYRVWSTAAGAAAAGAPAGAVLPVAVGQEYRLRVVAAVAGAGAVAEGTARVPAADRTVAGALRALDLQRDTVLLPALGVRAGGFVYSLRTVTGAPIDGDAQYRRAVEPRLVLPDGDDWAFAYARAELRAGTRHVLTVTAADSNYFAYYSADLDPFADRTARTTLRGASGLFGAAFTVYTLPVLVTRGAAP